MCEGVGEIKLRQKILEGVPEGVCVRGRKSVCVCVREREREREREKERERKSVCLL